MVINKPDLIGERQAYIACNNRLAEIHLTASTYHLKGAIGSSPDLVGQSIHHARGSVGENQAIAWTTSPGVIGITPALGTESIGDSTHIKGPDNQESSLWGAAVSVMLGYEALQGRDNSTGTPAHHEINVLLNPYAAVAIFFNGSSICTASMNIQSDMSCGAIISSPTNINSPYVKHNSRLCVCELVIPISTMLIFLIDLL